VTTVGGFVPKMYMMFEPEPKGTRGRGALRSDAGFEEKMIEITSERAKGASATFSGNTITLDNEQKETIKFFNIDPFHQMRMNLGHTSALYFANYGIMLNMTPTDDSKKENKMVGPSQRVIRANSEFRQQFSENWTTIPTLADEVYNQLEYVTNVEPQLIVSVTTRDQKDTDYKEMLDKYIGFFQVPVTISNMLHKSGGTGLANLKNVDEGLNNAQGENVTPNHNVINILDAHRTWNYMIETMGKTE